MLKGLSVKGIHKNSLFGIMSILEGQLWVKGISAQDLGFVWERGTPLNNSIDMKRDWVIRKELCQD